MRSVIPAVLGVLFAGSVVAEGPLIYPQPREARYGQGALAIDAHTPIIVRGGTAGLREVGERLARELETALRLERNVLGVAEVADDGAAESALRGIVLSVRPEGTPNTPGGYHLMVLAGHARLAGRDAAGVFYATLTLLQMLQPAGPGKGEIPCAEITDAPYHKYRGIRAHLPRGKPRPGEITHEQFRGFLRMAALCRLNHVWVEGTSWCVPMKRHPECLWGEGCTREQADAFVRDARALFLDMDGSLDWQWVYYGYKRLAELNDGETWEDMTKKVRRVGRVNLCPSNPETWTMLFETMDDVMDVLPGRHFAIPLDELYQEYQGSRWAACALCKDKDPVRLYAGFVNRLMKHAIDRGKTPVMSGGMLLREHQGWYKDLWKSIDLIENRDRILIYNWSEGHIRRGAMVVEGKRLQNPDLKATAFFREHGYRDVMHLFAGNDRWAGRPEMREVKGRLDCYGGFVSYYHAMDPRTMKQQGALGNLAFTAQHLWTPNQPEMGSKEDERACRYGEALCDAVFYGASYADAVALARKVADAPPGASLIDGKVLGRRFESVDPPVVLFDKARGDRTEGTMRIALPIEEANPGAAYLELTLYDWDQAGEGEIFLNGRRIELAVSSRSNGRDYTFEPVSIDAGWLKFGPEPNELRFVYKGTAGFTVKRAVLIVCDRPAGG